MNVSAAAAWRFNRHDSGQWLFPRGLWARTWLGCCGLFLSLVASSPAVADEFIDLTIPLRDGRFYSLRDIGAECSNKLQTSLLNQVEDRQFELTFAMKLALIAADRAGLIRVRIEPNQFVLTVPNAQDDQVRRQNRRRLEKLLGITLDDWPLNKGLHLPADFDPAARTLLLIHGLEGDATDLERFRLACRRWGIQSIIFDYPNDGPLAWSGERLAADLKELNGKYPNLRLAIVAHSMGGLVARQALELSLKSANGVTDLFFLGTPHRGSAMAVVQPVLEIALPLLQGSGFDKNILGDGLGEAGYDLRPGSEFLKRLSTPHRVAGVRYYAAIGKRSFITPDQRLALERKVKSLCAGTRMLKNVETPLLDFVRSEELQTGKGDGAVSLTSAHLDGIDGEKQFDLNHIELLALPGAQPDESPVFRWIMQTLGWSNGLQAALPRQL